MSGTNDAFSMNDAPMRIGRVTLKARDLAAVSRFYREVIGLAPISEAAGSVTLGAGGKPLLEILGDPSLTLADRREAGLFHTAFLLPNRADLGRWLSFAGASGLRLQGASDHAVSEAVYLADPEGNGIEIYADRPPSRWPMCDGHIEMVSERLDIDDLIAAGAGGIWSGMPDGGIVGHVHLQVGDTALAERHYGDLFGLDVTCRYPGASFFGSGGYHHQLAGNVWNSRGAGERPDGRTGLASFEIVFNEPIARAAVEARAAQAGLAVEEHADGSGLRDPWGTLASLRDG
ncbi:MAG: VOC family protein [Salinarimonadaceae bacterium]|nr:MAG: VOC family protein [Salinarimonadaceae bacterium]